ncbi:MAG TPA: lytic transglycosylase domain-containing protein [Bacteroidales bacterium]|nr:lytic transglycosylase domain-containing protein [Bacteroidales bacterium]
MLSFIPRPNSGFERYKSLNPWSDSVYQSSLIFAIPIPAKLSFAGEEVPLRYFDVRESLDRELHVNTFWHSQTVLLLKRANRYFPIIEPILKKNNIPDDFKYLAVAESGLTQAVSPSKAVGFWQILEGTAKEFGLEINKEVDERYHIEKSTEVACQYLKRAYEKYGTWTMAAAAYNFGMNGITKQIDRQDSNSYYDMILGDETGRYVYRILALKVIFENPKQYGFFLDNSDLYPPLEFTEVKVDSTITSIASFARQYGINYKLIKLFNPWLRENYLLVKQGKSYLIKIPRMGFREEAYK